MTTARFNKIEKIREDRSCTKVEELDSDGSMDIAFSVTGRNTGCTGLDVGAMD